MVNLLTEKDKNIFLKEKNTRIFNVFFIFFSLVFWCCIVALSPKMFFIYSDYRDVKNDLKKTTLNPASVDYKNIENLVLITKKQIDSARDVLENRPQLSKIIPELISEKPKNVSITNISFSKGDKDSNVYISGTALSREALREFSNKLKNNLTFSDVEIPVSNFAKSKENDFSMTLKLSSNYGK